MTDDLLIIALILTTGWACINICVVPIFSDFWIFEYI